MYAYRVTSINSKRGKNWIDDKVKLKICSRKNLKIIIMSCKKYKDKVNKTYVQVVYGIIGHHRQHLPLFA